MSGFRYSAQIGADVNRDGNSRNDRVPGTRRNQFTSPNVYQVDARIQRSIPLGGENMHLRLILEGFNIFNRANTGLAPGGGYFSFVNINQYRAQAFTVVNGVNTIRLLVPQSATPPLPPFGSQRSIITPRQLQLAVKFDF